MRSILKGLFSVKRAALNKSGKVPIIARITIDQDEIQGFHEPQSVTARNPDTQERSPPEKRPS